MAALIETPESETQLELRWEDIAREDGWGEDASIWRNIKYSDSSEDEADQHDSQDQSDAGTDLSDIPSQGRTAKNFIVQPEDVTQLHLILQAQAWRTGKPTDSTGYARKVPVAEFHIAREVLFMLQGFETTLFQAEGVANPAFQMAHLKWDTHKALISYFSEAGRQLAVLRKLVAQPQRASHLQVFNDTVALRLRNLDCKIDEIQARLVSPKDDTVVSLLGIKSELFPSLNPLYSLSKIVSQIPNAPTEAFRYLELLFDETSMAQLAGKLDVYEFLARLFIECFNVYLGPIRLWMDQGKIIPGDRIFFVSESSTQVPPSRIWRDQFRLRQTPDGRLHAPKFLQPAAARIFNAGKNIVILKRLGRWSSASSKRSESEPPLNYETICPKGFDLAPFPYLFDAAFDRWIHSKYNTTSITLKDTLFEDCGLWKALDSLQYLYFMSDGSATEAFTGNLFDKLDALAPDWHNRYSLTNSAQEGCGSLVDSTRLSVIVSPEGFQIPLQKARDSVRTALPTVRANYRLAWPVQMVLTKDSTSQYQAMFTLLLQLKRALHVLHKRKLLEGYWTDDENRDDKVMYYALRNSLLWFCTTLQAYLVTLVMAPNSSKMAKEMQAAHDVDAMIGIHAAFLKSVVDEACLGSRLGPIRECILDLFNLAIKLEQAHTANAAQEARQTEQPARSSTRDEAPNAKDDRDSDGDGGEDEEDEEGEATNPQLEKLYTTVLREIKVDFERHLRFICGGLRSIARATSDAQSAKWDILAEMLQMGSRDER